MGDVVNLGCVTKADLPPDRILEGAKGTLDGVLVIGRTKDGEDYFASSYADRRMMLWVLESFKQKLLQTAE